MKKRIIGIDVARALAVFGMIIVNFKMVLGGEGNDYFKTFVGVFEGKAAATFVVLAGVGLAMMSNSAIDQNDLVKLRGIRVRLVKRALVLFVLGLSYLAIWPADILHFYGIYMLFVLLMLKQPAKRIFTMAIVLIFSYPLAMLLWSYDLGWNFSSFEYTDFWTVNGFLRNLLYNGFHPVIPWAAFMLIGFWLGKQDLQNPTFVYKALRLSVIVFASIQLISLLLLDVFSGGDAATHAELSQVLGTSPMPPLPIYMISGSSIAIAIICFCILLAHKFPSNRLIEVMNKTGQLALTFYVAHVVLGMGLLEVVCHMPLGRYTIGFSLGYAIIFSLCCMLFATVWLKYKKNGPLEWIMRKLTN